MQNFLFALSECMCYVFCLKTKFNKSVDVHVFPTYSSFREDEQFIQYLCFENVTMCLTL